MKLTLQPDCLRWARERARLNVTDLAQKIGIKEDRVTAWEQSGEISFAHAEKLAAATHTPLGYLFLSEPPREDLPINDFRTISTHDISNPSPDLLDVVNDALVRQEWYREYMLNNGGEPLRFVGSLKVTDDIFQSAERIRIVVGWDADMRSQSTRWDSSLAQHINAVEELGVLVMRSGIVGNNTHRPLDVTEFRGFALSDEYAPLIFINARDAKAAQLFTRAHELVHIWLGVSGISNLNKTYAPDLDIERFCNSVAAELLVPLAELKTFWATHWNKSGVSLGISQATKHFTVSSLVLLRRLRDARELTEEEFQRRYTDEIGQAAPKTSTDGGGDFYRTLNARLGKRFVSALVESTLEGRTPYREALQLLGVNSAEKVHTLAKKVLAATA